MTPEMHHVLNVKFYPWYAQLSKLPNVPQSIPKVPSVPQSIPLPVVAGNIFVMGGNNVFNLPSTNPPVLTSTNPPVLPKKVRKVDMVIGAQYTSIQINGFGRFNRVIVQLTSETPRQVVRIFPNKSSTINFFSSSDQSVTSWLNGKMTNSKYLNFQTGAFIFQFYEGKDFWWNEDLQQKQWTLEKMISFNTQFINSKPSSSPLHIDTG